MRLSCVLESDYNKYLNSGFVANKVDEASISAGKWSWNNQYKAAHILGSTGVKEAVEFKLGYLKAGDKVTVSLDVLHVSGNIAQIVLDKSADNFTSSAVAVETFVCQVKEYFTEQTISFTATEDTYYRISVGTTTAQVGEFYLRDVIADIDTVVDKISERFDVLSYAQGSWTPSLSGTGHVYDTRLGTYTRVGNRVFINARIKLTTVGTFSGAPTIVNLPITPTFNYNNYAIILQALATGLTENKSIYARSQYGELALFDAATGTYLLASTLKAGSEIVISGSYVLG